jgi:hypothetical protein
MYLEMGLLGLYLSALTIRTKYLRVSAVLLLVLTFINTVRIPRNDRFTMEYYRKLKIDWKACYLHYSEISVCDQQTGHWLYKDGLDETIEGKLDYLRKTKQNLYSDVK